MIYLTANWVAIRWQYSRVEYISRVRDLTAPMHLGLKRGGSSTVHIYTQTTHRTTQSTQTIHRTTQFTN